MSIDKYFLVGRRGLAEIFWLATFIFPKAKARAHIINIRFAKVLWDEKTSSHPEKQNTITFLILQIKFLRVLWCK